MVCCQGLLETGREAGTSVHANTTVDRKRLASNIAGLWRAEECDGGGYFFRSAEARERRDAQVVVLEFFRDGGGQLGGNVARGNGIGRDAAAGHLACGRFRQGNQASLG